MAERRHSSPSIARPSGPPEHHAHTIAEAVDAAWHAAHGHGRLEVPLSVLAALAPLQPPYRERDDVARTLLALTEKELAEVLGMQWRLLIRHRPDLVNPLWPLAGIWLGEQELSTSARHGAAATARAALTRGLFHLTGDVDDRRESDLLGTALTVMRSRNAAQARGQFYTPGSVAEVMARLVGVPEEGETVHDPTVGTGGLFRAAAQAMRAEGRNPATVIWVGADIDATAVACLAVNAVLWELGPRVVLGVADTLAEPDWIDRALAERQETLDVAQRCKEARALVLAWQRAAQMVQSLRGDADNR
jgi:hypothetical protein